MEKETKSFEDADRLEWNRLARNYSRTGAPEEELREIIAEENSRSERTAAGYKMLFSGIFLVFSTISRLSGRPVMEYVVQLVTLGAFFGFNLWTYVRLTRPRPPGRFFNYGACFLEISLLSLSNFFQALFLKNPLLVYTSPMTLIYFILIALSAIHNRVRVILFTIGVVVVQCGLMALYFWPEMRELNANLRANATAINPAQLAAGTEFMIVTGRPVGISLKIVYFAAAGAAAIMAIRNSQRITARQIRVMYQKTVDRLVELDRIKTNFFTNISHEFRTPLTLILGPTESLLVEERARSDSRAARYLSYIRRNALGLLDLVNNLLDTARFAAGKMELDKQPVELAKFSREVSEQFRTAALERGLQLECEVRGEHVFVLADPHLLTRMYMNLLGNSLKFTQKGEIRIVVAADDRHARLSFIDTGPGIPEQDLDGLFERFSSIHRDAASGEQGSGLGLSLVQEIVAAHEGRIEYVTDRPSGARFDIRLPLYQGNGAHNETRPSGAPGRAAVPAAGPDLREASRVRARTHRLLIVEDKQEMREYLVSLFREQYRIFLARDGVEGLEKAVRFRPDLILSDVMMPRMDGFALLERVRATPALAAVPLLLLTAKNETEKKVLGLKRGADDFITKPFAPDELKTRVARSLYRRGQLLQTRQKVREEIISDLHDHLGGTLTDLSFSVRRARQGGDVGAIDANLKQTIEAFKACLSGHTFDDSGEEFLDGLQSRLLPRYLAAERGLEIDSDPESNIRLSDVRDEKYLHALYSVLQEISTNDLKYGAGRSTWQFRTRAGFLRLRIQARTTVAPDRDGYGRRTIRKRLQSIGARMRNRSTNDNFDLRILIPPGR